MMTRMTFGDVSVEVEFKDIKHLHLNVFPPDGRVRITAPKRMGAATVRAFAVSKLAWIKRQRRKFCAQPREAGLEYIDRESHYVWGRRYLLKVVEAEGVPGVRWQSHRLVLQVRSGTGEAARAALMAEWYRAALRQAAAELILKWQPVLKVRAGKLYVQRMKTKWGSCNPERGSIRLNTELAKKPRECLEYVVVHELAHLRARHHDDRFKALLDTHLPHWQQIRQTLNASAAWGY